MKPARPDFNRRRAPALHPPRVNPDAIGKFERLLAAGRDGALLRFSLGSEGNGGIRQTQHQATRAGNVIFRA